MVPSGGLAVGGEGIREGGRAKLPAWFRGAGRRYGDGGRGIRR